MWGRKKEPELLWEVEMEDGTRARLWSDGSAENVPDDVMCVGPNGEYLRGPREKYDEYMRSIPGLEKRYLIPLILSLLILGSSGYWDLIFG